MVFDIEKYMNNLSNEENNIHLPKIKIIHLPDLIRFTNLKILFCCSNELTYLPNLPNSLQKLYCGSNYLTFLPKLPEKLTYLYCRKNKLTTLSELPNSLQKLYCCLLKQYLV